MQSSKSLDVEVSCLVGGKVSVDQIISLCQSLGYYPAGTAPACRILPLCL